MIRTIWVVAATLLATSSSGIRAQSVPFPTRFEVVSIRVNRSGAPMHVGPLLQPGGRVYASNVPLVEVIKAAYGLRENQIIGAPDWFETTMFDIDARASGEPSAAIAAAMVRALLAERFALTAHAESRQLPVYLLTRVGGQQSRGLTRSGPECAPLTMPSGIPMPPPPPPSMTGIPLSVTRTPLRCPTIFALGSIGHVSARAITMDGFASALVGAVQRPVIDQTGLTGEFDIDLTYGSALEALPAGSPVDFSPVLFTAIREQLGLKLENARAPVQVLVIERVQRPTEN